jgi:hypothetical protein
MTKNQLLIELENYLLADINGSFYTLDEEKAKQLLEMCAKHLGR